MCFTCLGTSTGIVVGSIRGNTGRSTSPTARSRYVAGLYVADARKVGKLCNGAELRSSMAGSNAEL
jgi:hypothetical protein